MAYEKLFCVTALTALLAIDCHAQEPPEDHSCTVSGAIQSAFPFGKDGSNFSNGVGFQAGGGFAATRPVEPRRGVRLYITANFMYNRLAATQQALLEATGENPALAASKSAHGAFSALTLDPTFRYPLSTRISLYALGGFGWFRRGVGFNGANPATLTQPDGLTLGKLDTNSGVVDIGGGVNFGLKKPGVMLFAEARLYRGLAVNSATTLLPISVGVRW